MSKHLHPNPSGLLPGDMLVDREHGCSHLQVGSFLNSESWLSRAPIEVCIQSHFGYNYISGTFTVLGCLLLSMLFIFAANCGAIFRKSILDLHERFQCGSGWGRERTLNAWVIQQPWRKRLPLSFFETLFSTQSSLFFPHWKMMGGSLLKPMIVNTTEVRC